MISGCTNDVDPRIDEDATRLLGKSDVEGYQVVR